ncbi:DUF692 domain-containing protein [Ferrovibrio sp.]|uniref:MNIO family bufferin maturase n=1 Tax=Ferrovibrio sp. TaxID=1917215 RepID=UPI0035B49DEE
MADHQPLPAAAGSLPDRAGAGLKPEHYRAILAEQPDIGWFELHPENYMGAGRGAGGPPQYYLERIRALYPLSFHGVGLSIGSTGRLSRDHLQRLKGLMAQYQPEQFSEHLAWSSHGSAYMNDLLPLPYNQATLQLVAAHVDEAQDYLGRRMLIENPSTYVTFSCSEMGEIDFLAELARRTGCGLLLDINNAYVCAHNHGFDPASYIDAFPAEWVSEIHIAGHAMIDDGIEASGIAGQLLVDTHDRPACAAVWSLFRRFIRRAGPRPALIEWDNAIPAWPALHAEATRADRIMAQNHAMHCLAE